jgi:peroxiredoxin
LAAQTTRWAAADISAIAVAPATQSSCDRHAVSMSLTIPLLADPDRRLYSALAMHRVLAGTLQTSGTAIVDHQGTVRYLRSQANPQRSLDMAELEAALAQLP